MNVSRIPMARRWPELISASALLAVVIGFVVETRRLNDGTFTYCLDDAYIHLAIAKNLALHHVWGNTAYGFTSSSSSPLWILLLAAVFLIWPASVWAPLVLNVASGVGALFVAGSLLRRRGLPQHLIVVLLLVLALYVPLSTLAMVGMEHSLHILLVVLWVSAIDDALRTPSRRRMLWLSALAALLTATRFESLGLIALTGAILATQRRWIDAALIGLSGAAPVAAYAVFSLAHGWHALPSSILVKSPPRDWETIGGIVDALGGRSVDMLWKAPHLQQLLVLLLGSLWLLGRHGRVRLFEPPRALLLLAAATMLVHLQLAQIGWFYRYEAYLVAFGVLVLGLALAEQREVWRGPWRRWASAAIVGAALLMFGSRTVGAWRKTPLQTKNIYDQQWQMARFIARAVAEGTVAMNDIGTTSFLSSAHILDLLGLATLETGDELIATGKLANLSGLAKAHRVELAVIYEDRFDVPADWHLIGRWRAPEPVVLLGGPVVSFYVVEPSHTAALQQKLADFSERELPKDVGYWLPAGTRNPN